MTTDPLDSTWHFTPSTPKQINSVSISDDGSRCAFGSSFERGSGEFHTYLFDGAGNELWKKIIPTNPAYQGVFWVAISGDGNYVASGGEIAGTNNSANETPIPTKPGFLQAFESSTGNSLLDVQLDSRVNQVSLSHDGKFLAACYEKTITVYALNATASAYEKIQDVVSADYNINSCLISRNGTTLVASGIKYSDGCKTDSRSRDLSDTNSTTTTGAVLSYTVTDTTVTSLGNCTLSTGCMRVAVVDSGAFWAASLHDGSCVLFNANDPNTYMWQCKPDNPNLMLAYAVDVTQTDEGDVYVACGANLWGTGSGGFLYLVKSVRMVYDDDGVEYPAPYFKGVIQWSTDIEFGVNPGVSMDKNANYVSATDGKPVGKTVNESKGSFYLFSANDGTEIWKHDTTMMNWPMMLARDGLSVIGGSDEGSVYYWKAPYK